MYAKNPKFNCLKTTLAGGIAIGSENGEIRLFTKVGQMAKTLFPGSGGTHTLQTPNPSKPP